MVCYFGIAQTRRSLTHARAVAANLFFGFPLDYPSAAPVMEVVVLKGLGPAHQCELTELAQNQVNMCRADSVQLSY